MNDIIDFINWVKEYPLITIIPLISGYCISIILTKGFSNIANFISVKTGGGEL